ncbi:3'(2'),5'-bisphosphate nucleotidase CysQ [Bacillus taeanensis]|uniref:3'(2'),5'-bisphosphate nucleotidase CysQ n=1 Tax=Bacillus taeanensis TaxID=273032 RepID=A0A366XY46_9BACI|nr:3'(2'),5'-bisphosphate nucleotidase CysQ [Bacillus taeanensis]RBW68851.1 3'(2'),5'-bisphosphate nucleotidase [Bacillus taeanensis]
MIETITINDIVKISIEAGDKILEVYESADFGIESKADDSPLTMADKKANEVITDRLTKLYPEIPILSEEGNHLAYEERKDWEYFWLVDPLDGTKEFIKRNGEFTVNIALIHNGTPVLGVIYAPVLETVYFAKQGLGAYKLEKCKKQINGQVEDSKLVEVSTALPLKQDREHTTVIASRSHMSPETEAYINELKKEVGEVEITSAGSSLKLCLVAEGKADVYPRFAPTMEWDTGAGQAISVLSGASVTRTDSGEKLEYNKENLLNPWFIVRR